MSLNWDLTVCDPSAMSEKEWPVTQCLIWGTMIFNLSDLDEKNLKEWQWRIEYCKRCGMEYWRGPLVDGKPTAWWPTLNDLTLRLGMHTNAETKTRKQWLKKLTEMISDEIDSAMKEKP